MNQFEATRIARFHSAGWPLITFAMMMYGTGLVALLIRQANCPWWFWLWTAGGTFFPMWMLWSGRQAVKLCKKNCWEF